MATEEEEVSIAGCLSGIVLLPLSIFLNAWAFTRLWSWFAVPQFHAVPMPIATAIGLSSMMSIYRAYSSAPQKATATAWQDLWVKSLGATALYLIMGYIARIEEALSVLQNGTEEPGHALADVEQAYELLRVVLPKLRGG